MPELKDLIEKYPKIFKTDNQYTSFAQFGFECGDGWYNILDTLCNHIQTHIDNSLKLGITIEQVQISQVKEKFGGLRFYYDGGDKIIQNYVNFTEQLSEQICELSGEPGTIRNLHGRIRCLSDTEYEKWLKNV